MTKTCGKCKWYSEWDGDFHADDYGWCRAPIPMVAEDVSDSETDPHNNAKDCESYKKRKENHGTS